MARKALPALPISITLAVAFYFISRFVMEPVSLGSCLRRFVGSREGLLVLDAAVLRFMSGSS